MLPFEARSMRGTARAVKRDCHEFETSVWSKTPRWTKTSIWKANRHTALYMLEAYFSLGPGAPSEIERKLPFALLGFTFAGRFTYGFI